MQKSLLTLIFLLPVLSFSQNIQDQKVTVKYKQPSQVNINDGSLSYTVVVETPFLQKNQDSMALYELQKMNYLKEMESALEVWRMQNNGGDRNYWAQMANYENQVNAGVQGLQPPVMGAGNPFVFNKPYPKKPFLLKELDANSITAGIRIDGLKQNAGAQTKVILTWNGFEKGAIKENKSGTGPTTKYKYEIQFRHRVSLKIEVPGKGIVVNENIPMTEGFKSWTSAEYKTKGDFKLWWIDNEATFWDQRQSEMVMQHVSVINAYLTERVGYPNKQSSFEIYTVKSNKEYNYTDMTNAYTIAQDGFVKVEYTDKRSEVNQKLQQAIDAWNVILKESNIDDRKSRIDRHVTSCIYINMAYAYLWMEDFSNCEVHANKALGLGVNKYERDARRIIEFCRDLKQRVEANR